MPFGIELQLRETSSRSAAQVLYILLMMPGVTACLISFAVYPPVDARLPKGLMFGFFLFPVGLQLLSFVLGRPDGATFWRTLYVMSSIVLVLLAALVLLNGGLDKSPRNEVKTTVVQKTVLRGRQTTYDLVVSSWLPGRSVEHFNVASRVFDRAVVGKTATVKVHAGFFGIAWHEGISPE